jgi:hypothetical protein
MAEQRRQQVSVPPHDGDKPQRSVIISMGRMVHVELHGLSNANATTSPDHRRAGSMPRPQPNQRRLNMNKLITTTARKTLGRSFTAVLAVAAMTAVTAGVNTAKAWDHQATEAQMDNELNYRGAGGHSRHLSGPYASARSPAHFRGIDVGGPTSQRDFQLEGR